MSPKGILDQYRLTGFPFDLGRYDVKRVGRESEWQRLIDMASMVRESRSPVIGVLLGTYGAGKSFMLWQLAKTLDPASKTKVLASGPIRLVDPEQKRDFTKSLVLRFFTRGIDIESQLVPVLKSARLALQQLPVTVRPYVSLLLALTKKEEAVVARRILSGGRALRKESEEAGFPEVVQIRTSDDAIALLQALQIVVKSAGVDAVAMLVDEVEYIELLAKGPKSAVLDSLKHLWDQEVDFFSRGNDAAQLLLLLSATPDFWHKQTVQLLSEGPRGDSSVGMTPFFSRISKSAIIEMPAELAADEARLLIVSRMSEKRATHARDGIIPFTDDYVTYVYELSQGLPRRIIEICGVVIEGAAERQLKSIDRAAAKKILREMLISYERVAKK